MRFPIKLNKKLFCLLMPRPEVLTGSNIIQDYEFQ